MYLVSIVTPLVSAMKKKWEPTGGRKQKQQTWTDFLKLGLENREMFTHRCSVGFF